MEILITGKIDMDLANGDAFRQCLDLGLVANKDGEVSIANPIYHEVLARKVSYGSQ